MGVLLLLLDLFDWNTYIIFVACKLSNYVKIFMKEKLNVVLMYMNLLSENERNQRMTMTARLEI